MIVGFTGSREGMSPEQKRDLMSFFDDHTVLEVHHGDCIGADADFHELCSQHVSTPKIIIHPPNNPTLRAYKTGIICDPKPYLERNKDIVDVCQVLIACPKTKQEELRSGTWSTIRYARKIGRPVIIL